MDIAKKVGLGARRTNSVLQAAFKFGNPNTIIKRAVEMLGYPVGRCRAPFNYVPDEGVAAIRKILDENAANGLC